MKVVIPSNDNGVTRRRIIAPIGLDRPKAKDLQKGEYHSYKLRNVPTDDKSPTYELSIPYFSTGTPEEWLKFRKNLKKVLTGQNVTSGPGCYLVAKNLLQGDALARFENAATARGNETVTNFSQVLDDVTAHVFPARALQTQKRFMRRYLRKPEAMKTREWVARIVEINNYLPSFPKQGETTPTKLPDDELLDLMEFGVPNSWQRTMILQNFDPVTSTISGFVEFCERLERVEAQEAKKNKPDSTATEKADQKKKAKRKIRMEESNPGKQQTKTCMLHGDHCGHTTDECHTLKAQAKKMKGAYDAQHPTEKKNFKKRQELNALVSAAVEDALSKQGNKRKRPAPPKVDLNQFEVLSLSSDTSSDESDVVE